MYCSREYQVSTRLIQQYEKSTLNGRFSFLCRPPDVEMSEEIIAHVQAQFDSMPREQIIQMMNSDPDIDPLFDEAIAIWDNQLSQSDCHIPQGQQQN